MVLVFFYYFFLILDKYYFNVSEGEFSGYTFSLTKGSGSLDTSKLTLLQNNFYTNGLPGKSLNAHLYLDLSVVTLFSSIISPVLSFSLIRGETISAKRPKK